jgi:3',5'-cyclic AMP phosphodiesterase CpdA
VTAVIGQISDIHAEPGSASLKALGKALDYLSEVRPDAVIVSGDLSNKPHRKGYGLVREAFKTLRCPVLMVPGNADDREKMREALGTAGRWAETGPLHVAETVAGVRLIGLDVTVPGETFGEVTPGVLAFLRAALDEEPRLPALVFMHQHPFNTHGELDGMMCRNVEPLRQLLDDTETPVLALVCGHAHRAITARFGRTTAMMCPSLKTANPAVVDGYPEPPVPDAPGLMLHVVAGNSLVSHTVSLA